MNQMLESRSVESLWDAVELHLLAVKQAVVREVRAYPQPIAGCDAQIPALWERRDGIAAELDRLAQARRDATDDSGDAISRFIASSSYIDDEHKQEFRARLAHS